MNSRRTSGTGNFQFAYQSTASTSDGNFHIFSSTRPSARSGLVGLRNIGNTCFMNSVIQCLSKTRPLLEYLLDDQYLADINTGSSMRGSLVKAFASLMHDIWQSGEEHVASTTALKSQLQRFAPQFMGYNQQDAQEFLRYLLEGLHEDLNRIKTRTKQHLDEIDSMMADEAKADESWRRYLTSDDSKVADIFVGQLKSTLRCTSCGHNSVTYDPFWDLSLPLPIRVGPLQLDQCLESFAQEEVLDGVDQPKCDHCKIRRRCTKRFAIQKFPRILVLHLKRFSGSDRYRGKLNSMVEFPIVGLDLSPYATQPQQECVYNLYGVANHSGTPYSGHYTACCRHPYSGDWHDYNDSRVCPISPRSAVSSQAYLLFYELRSQTYVSRSLR